MAQGAGKQTRPLSFARQLTAHIRRIHWKSRKSYGSPRVFHTLRQEGVPTSENRVARLMQAAGIKARSKRAFRPRTTDSNHSHPIAPNQLKTGPAPTAPNQVWVADITYVWTAQGWVYLAAVMDLFSRKIVGWALSQTMETSLVKEALERAQKERRPQPGLLHHSDRGSQYASSAFRTLLHSWQIKPSMSGAACCYDNAAMESFWSTLKTRNLFPAPRAFENLARKGSEFQPSLITSKPFIILSGSTALWTINHLWTLKPKPTTNKTS